MTTCLGYSSIVYNNPNKTVGLPPAYYRWRSFDNTNLNAASPATQYQNQKLIQNTVRVYASLYTANLGPLSAYTPPSYGKYVSTGVVQTPHGPEESYQHVGGYGVCWNQMSDRPVPSVQRVTVPTGKFNSLNTRHYSVTSSKPGSQTPGGAGCDIKHNSYDRYLNRLKGKGPMRRGAVPPNYGKQVPFNPAYPVYGGKTIKTNIVTSCNCPIYTPQNQLVTPAQQLASDALLYNSPLGPYGYPNPNCSFVKGSSVYAMEGTNNYYTEATVIFVNTDGTFNIQFKDGTIQYNVSGSSLITYFPCNNCGYSKYYVSTNASPATSFLNVRIKNTGKAKCYLPVDLLTDANVIV
jgi:hypothetical protein